MSSLKRKEYIRESYPMLSSPPHYREAIQDEESITQSLGGDMDVLEHIAKADDYGLYEALGLYHNREEYQGTTPQVLPLVSSILEKSIRRNEKSKGGSRRKDEVTFFHGSKAPVGMSVKQYLDRIFRYSRCSYSCFVVGLVYIERYLQNTGACLTYLNIHRLLVTSMLLAAKFLDNTSHDNAYYAKIGGIGTAEMNRLEMKFLFSLEFRLHVTREIFNKYCSKIAQEGTRDYRLQKRDEIEGTQKMPRYSR